MTCIIVDDEPLAIEIVESYVSRIEQLQLIGTFRNAVAAFTFLQENPIDLIFLDIQMPKLSGIEFLKTLKSPPKVIITTAYRDYALDGFELEVADYLLKPISFERFLKAVAKVMHKEPVPAVAAQLKTEAPGDDYVFFKVDKKMVKTRMADILFEDNGIGVPKELLEKVFNMFFRANDRSDGAGLGLYIVKETVNKLNGTINMSSEVGEGTVFEIDIPNHHMALAGSLA